jgi:HD-like signal output (HDOD) protein
MDAMTAIDRFFQPGVELPVMPELAARLLKSFANDELTLGELADIIGQDVALATRLIRMANSAQLGLRSQVSGLRDASAMVGMNRLRGMALAACLAGAFPNPPGFDRHRFWGQNLATSGHARTLATLLGLHADTLATAGLVLRAGTLLMLIAEPGQTGLVEALAAAPDTVFELERQHFGCCHTDLSAELAVRWRFPTAMVDALQTAGDPLASQPLSRSGAALRLASVLADAGTEGLDPVDAMVDCQAPLVERLRLDLGQLRSRLQPHEVLTAAAVELVD